MAGRKPTVSDQEILAVFRETEDPVLTSGEIAEQISLSRRGVGNRLDKLHEDGQLERKQVGVNTHIYFLPATGTNTDSPLSKFQAMNEEGQIEEMSLQLMAFFEATKDMDIENRHRVRSILFKFINRRNDFLWPEGREWKRPTIPERYAEYLEDKPIIP